MYNCVFLFYGILVITCILPVNILLLEQCSDNFSSYAVAAWIALLATNFYSLMKVAGVGACDNFVADHNKVT